MLMSTRVRSKRTIGKKGVAHISSPSPMCTLPVRPPDIPSTVPHWLFETVGGLSPRQWISFHPNDRCGRSVCRRFRKATVAVRPFPGSRTTYTHRISTGPNRWPRPCDRWSRRRRPAYRWARCAGRRWRATRAPAARCRSRTWPRRTAGARSRASRSCWRSAWTPPHRWCRTRRTRPPGWPETCGDQISRSAG